ncbi:WapI family immunity protein [Spirosoma areae]
MKFSSSSGSFELAIVGYGTTTTSWRDRNRLQCKLSTFWRQKTDTQSAPLQTWEINRLLSGLRSLWDKATNRIMLTFSEPGLSVEAVALPDNNYRLHIQLGDSLTPSWHDYPDFPLEMDILVSHNQLRDAIQDLSGELASYPER